MNKPTLYLETSVIGHLAARPQADFVAAARQLSSTQWWNIRTDYELFISQIVVDECAAGDPVAESERLLWLAGISVVDIRPEANILAQQLINLKGIPQTEPRVALHIAVAAVTGLQYLLTWNFKHIANASTRSLIEKICVDAGYVPPTICSPDELLGT